MHTVFRTFPETINSDITVTPAFHAHCSGRLSNYNSCKKIKYPVHTRQHRAESRIFRKHGAEVICICYCAFRLLALFDERWSSLFDMAGCFLVVRHQIRQQLLFSPLEPCTRPAQCVARVIKYGVCKYTVRSILNCSKHLYAAVQDCFGRPNCVIAIFRHSVLRCWSILLIARLSSTTNRVVSSLCSNHGHLRVQETLSSLRLCSPNPINITAITAFM